MSTFSLCLWLHFVLSLSVWISFSGMSTNRIRCFWWKIRWYDLHRLIHRTKEDSKKMPTQYKIFYTFSLVVVVFEQKWTLLLNRWMLRNNLDLVLRMLYLNKNPLITSNQLLYVQFFFLSFFWTLCVWRCRQTMHGAFEARVNFSYHRLLYTARPLTICVVYGCCWCEIINDDYGWR